MPVTHNAKGRSKRAPPFVQLPWYLLDSDAWRASRPTERAAYVELERLYNGRNNGRLALSVRDLAERLGVNKDTASVALKALQSKGLIICVTPGGFSRKIRHATEWRLTNKGCDKSGGPPTKEFARWKAGEPEESILRSQKTAKLVPSGGTVMPFEPRKVA